MKNKSSQLKGVHFLRLMKGEPIIASILEYCKNNNILSGYVQGIGAVSNPSIGYFDLEKREYLVIDKNFNAELVNCSGNLAINKETGELIAHLHMVIGDSNGQTFGGHVMPNNTISVTGEFIIFETEGINYRTKDDTFGLMLLDF
ncbi:DNA-binding protein [Candidatus Heimdallarchaeota archaeon]|nr:MAG: DNA-binding protein [Candidatus Heimdallarchaeota archaeon]